MTTGGSRKSSGGQAPSNACTVHRCDRKTSPQPSLFADQITVACHDGEHADEGSHFGQPGDTSLHLQKCAAEIAAARTCGGAGRCDQGDLYASIEFDYDGGEDCQLA